MGLFESILLGIIQGLTEFLPVSSSGHLAILGAVLGISDESDLTYAVALHLGTVFSTIVVFRKELLRLVVGFFKFKMNPETVFILKIGVSMIPILVVGLTLKDEVESIFQGSLLVVGLMLFVTGALLLFTSMKGTRESKNNDITYWRAFLIGVAQAFAVLPGLSRSGSTISAGLLLGVKKQEVAKFSFLMVLIPILGINFLDLISSDFSGGLSTDYLNVFVGFLTSFVVGTLACKLMISVVAKGDLKWFAYYCFLIGVIAIIIQYA